MHIDSLAEIGGVVRIKRLGMALGTCKRISSSL